MSKKKRITAGGLVGKTPGQTIILRQPVRGGLDIGVYMNAIRKAEVVDYPQRARLLDLYDDIALDSHLFSVLRKQKAAVLSSPIQFMRDGKVDEKMADYVKSPWFLRFLGDLVDHDWFGVGGTLFQFYRDEGGWINYDLIPRKNVDAINRVILRNQTDLTGESWDEFDNLLYIGNPRQIGDLAVPAFWVILKRNNVGDWADFAEIFSRPVREGTYDAWDEEARQKLLNDIAALTGAGVFIHPSGTDLKLIQADNVSGGGDLYEKLGRFCNNEISKAVNGDTLTTEAGDKGTQALGSVQKEGEEDINFFVKQRILNVLNYEMTDIFANMGMDTDGGEFFFIPPKSRNSEEKVNVMCKLRNEMDLPIGDDYLYEEFGIPKPDNYEELKEELRRRHAPLSLPDPDDDDPDDGGNESGPAEDGADGDDPNNGKKSREKGGITNRLERFFAWALQGGRAADLDW